MEVKVGTDEFSEEVNTSDGHYPREIRDTTRRDRIRNETTIKELGVEPVDKE